MSRENKTVNLVMGGGGIKGIAYLGVFEAAEQRGYSFGNIAGVSAGSLAGSFAGAGYNADELHRILNEFDIGKINIDDIPKKVPAVLRYIKFCSECSFYGKNNAEYFLSAGYAADRLNGTGSGLRFSEYRGNLFKNIITFSKEGCLFDGDYLEEWVSKTLAVKGIRTFGDYRGGIKDKANPRGYKVRMTAADINREKILVLPDDIAFYGADPDRFEVARAVRMSTCVPLVFKSVEVKKKEGNSTKTYHVVDGGVFDSFPFWTIDRFNYYKTVGFRLDGGENKLLSISTPLNILKALISVFYDLGVPKAAYKLDYIESINTSKVPFLDFGLNDDEKNYLYNAGKYSAAVLFDRLGHDRVRGLRNKLIALYSLLRKQLL